MRQVTVPDLGGLNPLDYRVSRDDRRVYFPVSSAETDIWLVKLSKE